MVNDEIIARIQKLLNMTPAHGCTESEAATAMANAQNLLLKHNLDMATIKAAGTGTATDDDSALINTIVDFSDYETWQGVLLNVIAKTNFCHAIRVDKHIYHILGRRANVAGVEMMYNWVEPQIINLIIKSGYKRGDKSSYAYGIINTVSQKLEDSMADYQKENPTSTALIVNIQGESDRWYKTEYPHVTSVSTRRINASAYHAGKADGGRVSVHASGRQISSGRLLLS